MPQRLLQSITGFQGVANSATGTLNLPPNQRYHGLTLFLTVAGVAAAVNTVASNLKLKVGGVTIRDMSPQQCVDIAESYGLAPAVGELPIFFSEPWFDDPAVGEMFSWDMVGQGDFVLEMTFLNPGGGAVGVANVVAEVDTIRNEIFDRRLGKRVPFLRILKMKNQTALFGGAGVASITTLDRSLPIRRLLMTASAGTISTVEVIGDSISLWNQISPTQLNDILEHKGIDGSQFSASLIFDYDLLGRSKLEVGNLEVKVNPSAANTLTVLNVQEAMSFA